MCATVDTPEPRIELLSSPVSSWTLPKTLPSLAKYDRIALDVETFDPDLKAKGPGVRTNGKLVGIGVGTPDGKRYYLPFGHETGRQFTKKRVLDWARKELCRPGQGKVGANLIYDLDYLAEAGVPVTGPFHDVLIAEPLIDENHYGDYYNLDSLGRHYLNEGKSKDALQTAVDRLGLKGDPRQHIWRLPPEVVGEYVEGDVDLPLRIFELQKSILADENLTDLFSLETRLIPLLLAMRRRGVRVDPKKAVEVRDDLIRRAEQAQKQIDELAGYPLNIRSAAEISDAFDRLGLKYPKTALGNPSFRKDWLEAQGDELSPLIVKARQLTQFTGTFIESAILESVVGDRLHCQFHQLKSDDFGTVTGRLSASNPPLHQIPSRDVELAPLIRGLFIPEDGEDWGRADYSQIEYRLLAHYGIGPGADGIRRIYNEDSSADYHQMVADMTGLVRDIAKNLNFATGYGAGAQKIATTFLKSTLKEAQDFLDKYHRKLPFIKQTSRLAMTRAGDRGYVRTILGRRRRFPSWTAGDFNLSKEIGSFDDRQEAAEAVRQAIADAYTAGVKVPRSGVRRSGTYKALNAVIQGSAADMLKKAMVDVWESGVCDVLGVPLLTVHDELDFSVPRTKGGKEAFAEQTHIMETAIPLRVPVLVDAMLGANWGECK